MPTQENFEFFEVVSEPLSANIAKHSLTVWLNCTIDMIKLYIIIDSVARAISQTTKAENFD